MPVETRYFRSDYDPVLTGYYRLLTSNTTTSKSISYSIYTKTSKTGMYLRISVYVRHADGSLAGVANGASVFVSSGTITLYTGTISIPYKALTSTDRILIYIQTSIDGRTWYSMPGAGWITEELGAGSLDAATWTVYYYARFECIYDPDLNQYENYVEFYFGNSTYPSRIENFTWSPPAPVTKKPIMDGLVFVE
jgi:hypothetical protein